VLAELDARQADAEEYVQPQRSHADIVVSFTKRLDADVILRDTLPHPDLSPLLDGSGPSLIKREREWLLRIPGDLDPAHAAEAIRGERRIGVNVDGSEHTLDADDMILVMQPLEGYEVEAEAGRAVALALELDDELRAEGLAREIVHAIQNARREAGLDVSDRIELRLGGDEQLLDAARAHESYIAAEVLAKSVTYDGAEPDRLARIDGRELLIAVERTS
jgi:isoleucyl-tRNA synthetase